MSPAAHPAIFAGKALLAVRVDVAQILEAVQESKATGGAEPDTVRHAHAEPSQVLARAHQVVAAEHPPPAAQQGHHKPLSGRLGGRVSVTATFAGRSAVRL